MNTLDHKLEGTCLSMHQGNEPLLYSAIAIANHQLAVIVMNYLMTVGQGSHTFTDKNFQDFSSYSYSNHSPGQVVPPDSTKWLLNTTRERQRPQTNLLWETLDILHLFGAFALLYWHCEMDSSRQQQQYAMPITMKIWHLISKGFKRMK